MRGRSTRREGESEREGGRRRTVGDDDVGELLEQSLESVRVIAEKGGEATTTHVHDGTFLPQHLQQIGDSAGDVLLGPDLLRLQRLCPVGLDDLLELLADGCRVLSSNDLGDDGDTGEGRSGVKEVREVGRLDST